MKKQTNDQTQHTHSAQPAGEQPQQTPGGDLSAVADRLEQCADQLRAPQAADSRGPGRDALRSLVELLIQVGPVILSRL